MSKWAVGKDSDSMFLAPRKNFGFDRAPFQVIKNLIAHEMTSWRDLPRLAEITYVKIADSPGEDLAVLLKLLEGGNHVRQGIPAAPVQEVTIKPIGIEAPE